LLALHVCPAAQLPHWSVPVQPSDGVPHCAPSDEHVFGTQVVVHWLFWQVWPAGQVPHINVPVQPSDAEPHCRPRPEHVFGVQPPPHVPLVLHVPAHALPLSAHEHWKHPAGVFGPVHTGGADEFVAMQVFFVLLHSFCTVYV
jgi:hypothetical protein